MRSAIIDIRKTSGSLGATVEAALTETNTSAAETFRLRVVTPNDKRFPLTALFRWKSVESWR